MTKLTTLEVRRGFILPFFDLTVPDRTIRSKKLRFRLKWILSRKVPGRARAESARPDSEPGANDTGSHPAWPRKPCGRRGLTTVLSHGHSAATQADSGAGPLSHGGGSPVPEPALTRTFCS